MAQITKDMTIGEILRVDIDNLTPMEALNKLNEIKKLLGRQLLVVGCQLLVLYPMRNEKKHLIQFTHTWYLVPNT